MGARTEQISEEDGRLAEQADQVLDLRRHQIAPDQHRVELFRSQPFAKRRLQAMDIRPNTVSLVEGFFTLRDNARIESYQPHLHLRGKAMMVEWLFPTVQKQVLSLVSDFNFNWMTTYVYSDDAAPLLPKGRCSR